MITKAFTAVLPQVLIVPMTLLVFSIGATDTVAQVKLYSPIPLSANNEVSDKLSGKDIPTGQGGFARDYMVKFNA